MTDLRKLFQSFETSDMRPTTIGFDVELASREDCEDHLQARQLGLLERNVMPTPARIIVASSHPKLAMIQVRVHTRSMMKNHASARNAIVILSDCSPAWAISSNPCTMFRSNGSDCEGRRHVLSAELMSQTTTRGVRK
jgi:hypothetical protein